MQKVYIYLENGTFLEGNSFGANTTQIGKLVYNNATTGHQEIITDPANAGLFINFTTAEIGNIGANRVDFESTKAHAKGVIVRTYHDKYSNYRADYSLSELLKQEGLIGICDIDTRYLTKIVRENGTQLMIASTEISSKEELAKKLQEATKYDDINFLKDVSTKEAYIHKSGAWNMETQDFNKASMSDKKVVVIDFGVKKSVLNELVESGLEVEVVPSSTKADTLIKRFEAKEIGGIFLSSGAGNPNILKDEITEIKKLLDSNIPIFAMGLGHLLLALANGVKVERLKSMKYGSHPIKDEKTVEIFTLNTDYEVSSDINKFADITYTNLFTNHSAGLKYKNKDIFSVSFYPPSNSKVYKEFAQLVK